jgi:PadR family transcriptional regulator, regulatory protein PadR
MSNKRSKKNAGAEKPGAGKAERYIQPSVLLALKANPSYGYELIQGICKFGFVEGQAPPGMIYRHLRDLEENGLVSSEWKTDEAGPAKRMYQLTPEGERILEYWIAYMKNQAGKLLDFIRMFEELERGQTG